MSRLATTKLSSRGQVVIPEEIREQMRLHTGDQFVVLSENDVVILKVISRPDSNEFTRLISKAHLAAKEAGLQPSDIEDAIKEARQQK